MKLFVSLALIVMMQFALHGQGHNRFPNEDEIEAGKVINLGNLNFPPDSATLHDPTALLLLDSVLDFLGMDTLIHFEILGHSSGARPGTGIILPPFYALSHRRAEAVAFHLIHRGIEPQRIEYRGYGPERPIASNSTDQGRHMNQRVEIKILKRRE